MRRMRATNMYMSVRDTGKPAVSTSTTLQPKPAVSTSTTLQPKPHSMHLGCRQSKKFSKGVYLLFLLRTARQQTKKTMRANIWLTGNDPCRVITQMQKVLSE
eukprot:g13823.t1